MPGKDAASTEGALDALEKAVGKAAFARMFGLILTDNGPEFADRRHRALGMPGAAKDYCDARQSQQKGG